MGEDKRKMAERIRMKRAMGEDGKQEGESNGGNDNGNKKKVMG